MKYQEVTNYSCDAQENDWLSVTYTQRNYIKEDETQKPVKKKDVIRRTGGWFHKNLKYVVAGVLLLAVVAGMLLAGGEGGVFQTARTAYTSTLLEDVGAINSVTSTYKVNLPATLAVEEITEDGTVVLSGGKVAQCLQSGTVTAITESTLTVKISDDTEIVYSALTDILVKEGETVEQYACLGRYDGSMRVNVVCNGEIAPVTSGGYTLEWQA